MKEETKLLIKMVNEDRTLNEISSALGLSNKQVFTRLSMLKNSGYLFDREYYYNGEISYSIANPFLFNHQKNNEVTIKCPPNIDKIRAVLSSDDHLGNKNDNLNCAHLRTEYCLKEGIHLHFNTGDFFQGIYEDQSTATKYQDPFEQIQYVLKEYPYDKSILTFLCLGNHDASFWKQAGIDIKSVLLDRRHDIVPVGYGKCRVNIGKQSIIMSHPISSCNISEVPGQPCLILRGHSHKFKIVPIGLNGLLVYVPTSSSVGTVCTPNPVPSIVDMELTLKNGNITSQYFQYYMVINNQLIRVGEFYYKQNITPKSNNINASCPIEKPTLSAINSTQETVLKSPQLEAEEEVTTSLSEQLGRMAMEIIEEIRQEDHEKAKQNMGPSFPKNAYQGMTALEKFNARYGVSSQPSAKYTLKKGNNK